MPGPNDTLSAGERHKQVARDWFEAFVAQDTDRLRTLMTPDARWMHNGSVDISGAYEGVDAIIENFVKAAHPLFVPGTMAIEISLLLAEGNTVALEFVSTGISAATGKNYNNPYGLFLEFRDGLIAEAREYVDTAHSADVLYLKA
jgi:ketosteroid isomerase-like protein